MVKRPNSSKKKALPVAVGVLAISRKKPGQVVLVTSRHSKSWTLPKGQIERALGAAKSAKQEAWEEAGLRGRMSTSSIGSYIHRNSNGEEFRVRVFKMSVQNFLPSWPEKNQRQRRWVSAKAARKLISNSSLRRLLEDHFGISRKN